jgi:hypothetical protein
MKASDIVRALVALPEFSGYKAVHDCAVGRSPTGNEKVICVQSLRRATSPFGQFVVTFGVRSSALATFDATELGMPQQGRPHLGLLHYERSLGWLLRREEPVFSGRSPGEVAATIAEAVAPRVLPHLDKVSSDEAIADALLATTPFYRLPRHELLRLRFLLSRAGRTAEVARVEEALRDPGQGKPSDADLALIADVNRDIEAAIGGVAVKSGRRRARPARDGS